MRVSQRVDYALRTLLVLASQQGDGFVAAGDLADRLNFPRRFVEQQITELARAGIVRSRRGASGGCALARPADAITALEVVEAIQGAAFDIPHHADSAVTEMWEAVQGSAESVLAATTLASLVAKQRTLDSARVAFYDI